ncbi:MAG: hypothetical protein AMJ95_02000 [Omnitrophica WOR_2 bacterium SM23_72]|nr:MAG: hypothetical protein AMJ95_02000 [Omnitrophica WOR_2 bacterium SM23_72]
MKIRIVIFMLFVTFFVLGNGKTILAEGVTKGGAIPQSEGGGNIQWVWGDVVNVDTQNKTLTVKYLDYETDQDNEISIGIDDQTTFENIMSLDEIKIGDVVSVDYSVDVLGKNVAKNISVEKPEAMPEIEEPAASSMEKETPAMQE